MRIFMLAILALTLVGCKGINQRSEIDRFLSEATDWKHKTTLAELTSDLSDNSQDDNEPGVTDNLATEFRLSEVNMVIGSGVDPLIPTSANTAISQVATRNSPKPGSGLAQNPGSLKAIPLDRNPPIANNPNAAPKKNASAQPHEPLPVKTKAAIAFDNPLRPRVSKSRITLRELVRMWSGEYRHHNSKTNPCPIIDCDTCRPKQKPAGQELYTSAVPSIKVETNSGPLVSKTEPQVAKSSRTLKSPVKPMPICIHSASESCQCNGKFTKLVSHDEVETQPIPASRDPLDDWANSPDDCELSNWEEHIQQTLDTLANEIEVNMENCNPCRLRLMRMLAGNIVQATEPVDSIPIDVQSAFTEQMLALESMLQISEHKWEQTEPTQRRKTVRDCLVRLQLAVKSLSNGIPPQATNPQLCSAIRGFGQYEKMHDSITSNNDFLLYCEVDHLKNIQVTDNSEVVHETRVAGTVEILDENGNKISISNFPPVVDKSYRARRDYFVYFPLKAPSQPGNYRIVARIRDQNKPAKANANLAIIETTMTVR